MEAAAYPVSKPKGGISGSTLKLTALTAMLIDHTGAALLGRLLMASGFMDAALSGSQEEILSWVMQNKTLFLTYLIMRMIGRIAFPIFCFLLVEGFQKTHDRRKYALRLGLFALISEIPFDLAVNSQVLEFSWQNVFFTLFLGVVAMAGYDAVCRKQWCLGEKANRAVRALLCAALLLLCCIAAQLLHTDYSAVGVICITVLYAFRNKKPLMIAAGCIAFLWELTAPLAFLPIAFYNGKRGIRLKYVFYLFYPVHLLLLYLIALAMGIAGNPAM